MDEIIRRERRPHLPQRVFTDPQTYPHGLFKADGDRTKSVLLRALVQRRDLRLSQLPGVTPNDRKAAYECGLRAVAHEARGAVSRKNQYESHGQSPRASATARKHAFIRRFAVHFGVTPGELRRRVAGRCTRARSNTRFRSIGRLPEEAMRVVWADR